MKRWDEAQWARTLRAEAEAIRREAPAEMKAHVLRAVAGVERASGPRIRPAARWLAAAAAATLLAFALGPALLSSAPPTEDAPPVAPGQSPAGVALAIAFGPGAPWVVPTEAFEEVVEAPQHVERHVEDPLLTEVRSLASDTDTLLDRWLRGLPGPLERCLPFGRFDD